MMTVMMMATPAVAKIIDLDTTQTSRDVYHETGALMYRGQISQRRFGPPGILAWLWKLKLTHWLGVSLCAGALLFLLALIRRGDWGPACAALGGGFCSMVAQVVVLYVFQSAHGLLYSHMGLLGGAFMLGALAGARAARRIVSARLAFAILAALSLYCLALPFLLSAFAASSSFAARYLAFPGVSAAAGFLAGALFCACANLAKERSAGRIYSADLAGASAGALLAGLVLVPSLGLYDSALAACLAGVFLAFPLLPGIIRRTGRQGLST